MLLKSLWGIGKAVEALTTGDMKGLRDSFDGVIDSAKGWWARHRRVRERGVGFQHDG